MTIASHVELSVETMKEIAGLANSVMGTTIFSTEDLNRAVVKIAEPAGILAGDVLELTKRHITQRFPNSHNKVSTDAYRTVMSPRDKK